ncbi:uncharacterized protein LOC135961930 [Calliphora vicina]|uniref:uncharacterized protein LOC135961930 n=1 Tax=Calliphora vicina TaxID=7373 RepID=UPI00325AF8AE
MTSIEKSLKNRFNKPKKTKTSTTRVTGKASKTIKISGTKKVILETNKQGIELHRKSYDTTNASAEALVNGINSTDTSKIEPKINRLLDKFANDDDLQNAIAEIESSGSSSVSEDSPESEEEQKDLVDIIEKPEKFLEFGIISDDESLIEEESYYTKQNKLENELDVLGMFEDVPQLDEISLAMTDDLVVKLPIAIEIDSNASTDVGKFVNPLTGVKSSSSTLSTISKKDNDYSSTDESKSLENDKEDKEEQGFKSDTSYEDEFEKDIVDTADILEDVNDPVKDADEIFQQFLEKEKEIEAVVSDEYNAAKIALISEEHQRQIQQHTLEFLNKLIDHCVAKSDYINADMILRKSLDKRKLINELKATYDLLEMERRGTQFLNRKCVEYFKRKSCLRVISPDDPKTLKSDSLNYYNALDNLDKWLIRKEKMKSLCSNQVLEARDQFKEAEQQSNEKVYQLEQLVKTTFQLENYDKLQTFVINTLSKMAAIRKEISKVRFQLLLKQHQVSALQKQRTNLEDLGNGLNLTQYETMETETNVLSKKLEERNSALKKLHDHFNFDLHNMAHLQEKQKMLRQIVTVQKEYLEEVKEEKKQFRKFVFQLKVKRQQLRSDIRNASFQSGLLDKPVLMKDYDETVETANKLRQTIEDLKCTIAGLNTKISALKEI